MDVDVKQEPSEMPDEQEFLLCDVMENGEEMETIEFDDIFDAPSSSKEANQLPTGLKVVAPRGGHKATCNGYLMHSLYTNSEGLLYWRCSKHSSLSCPGSALSEGLDGTLIERDQHNHPVKNPGPKKSKVKKKLSHKKVPIKPKNAPTGLSKGKGSKRCRGNVSVCSGYEMQSDYMTQDGAVSWRCPAYRTLRCKARACSKGIDDELLETKSHNHPCDYSAENENAVPEISELANESCATETVEASPVNAREIQSKQYRQWRTALCNDYAMRVQRVLPIGIRWKCLQKASFKCPGWATSDLDGTDLTQQGPHNHVALPVACKIKKRALMAPACLKRRANALLKPREKRPSAKSGPKRKPTAKSSRHLLRCDAQREIDGYFMRCANANVAPNGTAYWVCRQRKGFKCNGSATSGLDGEQFTMRQPHNHDPAPLRVRQSGVNGVALKWDRHLLRCDAYKEVDGYFMRCSTASSNDKAYWVCRQTGSFKCKASATSDLDGKGFTLRQPHNHDPAPLGPRSGGTPTTWDRQLLRCDALKEVDGYFMRCSTASSNGVAYWACRQATGFKCKASASTDLDGNEFTIRQPHNHNPAPLVQRGGEEPTTYDRQLLRCDVNKEVDGYFMRCSTASSNGVAYWVCRQATGFKCKASASTDLDGNDFTMRQPHNHDPAPLVRRGGEEPTTYDRQLLRCDLNKEVDGYFMRCSTASSNGVAYWVCRQATGFKCKASASSDLDGVEFTMRQPHNHDPAPLVQRGGEEPTTYDRQLLRCDLNKEVDGYFMRCSNASSNGNAYWGCRQKTGFKCSASATSDLDGKEFTMRQPHNHDPAPLVRRGGEEPTTRDRHLLRSDPLKEIDGYFMRCSTASSNGVAYWGCRQRGGFDCNASATSNLDGEEFTMRQPHNHDPAPLGLRGGGATTTRDRHLLRSDPLKEVDGYFMRCITASSNGVAYWCCRQRGGFECKASATTDLDGEEFTMRQPHNHDPAPLAPRQGRKSLEGTLPAWCTTDRRNLRSDMDAEGTHGSTSNEKYYTDDSDDSDRSESPARPKKILELARKVAEKKPISPFYGKCRGRMALCDGYHMCSVYVTKKGLLYWKCAKQTTFKCPGSAMSDPDGDELVESQAHNHEPVPLYKWTKKILPSDNTSSKGDVKPASGRKVGRPRTDSKWKNRNLHLLRCDIFATVDGYLMRCMNVSVGTGMSYWYCRLCMRFKCRGSATSDLYGKDFMPVQPHNHPPEGMVRKSSSAPSSFGSSTKKWFKDSSDDDQPTCSYKSQITQTVKAEKREGAGYAGTSVNINDEFDKLVAASAGFVDFYVDLTHDDALVECDS